MKKLIYIALLLAACKSGTNHDGTYVSHTEGQFSIADDTLIIADTVVINRTGFQKYAMAGFWLKRLKPVSGH